ncbi:hypothetical protein A9Q99_19770 [Gammaproteobacteria bacterium 45_16_T64]|nr:hypothetical protein A9Q99_19770 [Gammaproteobacteria bacterium 45_16_T64]
MNQQHFGFEIEETLYRKAQDAIQAIGAQPNAEQLNQQVAEALVDITEVGFVAYYYKPSDMVTISSVVRKAADSGIVAVKRGVHMVIRKLFKKMDPSELQKLASYMDALLVHEKTADGKRFYVAFNLSSELFELAQELLARVRQDPEIDGYRQNIIAALNKLIRAGVEAYYETPSSMIKLGRVTRKTADLGITTAEKGSNIVVKKLFKVMPHEALIPLSSYFESLLHSDLESNSLQTP